MDFAHSSSLAFTALLKSSLSLAVGMILRSAASESAFVRTMVMPLVTYPDLPIDTLYEPG